MMAASPHALVSSDVTRNTFTRTTNSGLEYCGEINVFDILDMSKTNLLCIIHVIVNNERHFPNSNNGK